MYFFLKKSFKAYMTDIENIILFIITILIMHDELEPENSRQSFALGRS